MDRIQLDKAQQKLEAANISGCIFVYLDDQPSIRLKFNKKLRVYFEVSNVFQTSVTGCNSQEQADLDKSAETFTPVEREIFKEESSNNRTNMFSDNEDDDELSNNTLSGIFLSSASHLQIGEKPSTGIWKDVEDSHFKTEPGLNCLDTFNQGGKKNKPNIDDNQQEIEPLFSTFQQSKPSVPPMQQVSQNQLSTLGKTQDKKFLDEINVQGADSLLATKQEDKKALLTAYKPDREALSANNQGDSEASIATNQGDGGAMVAANQQNDGASTAAIQEDTCSPSSTAHPSASSSRATVPLQSTSQPGLSCSYCNESFSSQIKKETHHRVSSCARQCRWCKEEFLCSADLFMHQFKEHGRECVQQEFPAFTICEESLSNQLQCPICSRNPIKMMHLHVQANHFSEKSYCCCVCLDTFKTPACLHSHLEQHLSKKRNQPSCSGQADANIKPLAKVRKTGDWHSAQSSNPASSKASDKVSFKNSPSANSSNSQSAKYNFHCKHCSKTFGSSYEMVNHKTVSGLKIQCPKCPSILKSQTSLVIHDFHIHDKTFISYLSETKIKGDLDDLFLKRLIRCPLCNKSTAQLKEHIAAVHISEMLYQCCVCEKKCLTSEHLKRHCDTHLKPNKGKFRCSKCPFVTTSRSDSIKHALTHGTQCVFCNIDFGHKHLLWPHYESQHADQIFTCTVCDKKIPTKQSFEDHMRYHRFNKLKVCPVCGITIKSNINRHILRAHHGQHLELTDSPDQQKKYFPCPKCTSILRSHQSLQEHMKSHEGKRIPCPSCDKNFSSRANLTKHIDTVHLKATKHVCEICGKEATTKHNLMIHKRIHATTKLFFCEVCGQGFNYKASLEGHMKSKHKEHQLVEKKIIGI